MRGNLVESKHLRKEKMKQYIISAFAASNVGKRRQNNEDNYFLGGNFVNSALEINAKIENQTQMIVSVCDGMGGEEAGELASQLACETVCEKYTELISNGMSDESISAFVNSANEKICVEISKKKKRIGTTYTLLGVIGDTVTVSNIGDSRVYHYSEKSLKQISRDHTQAQTMVDSGLMSAEQAMKTPEKHKLTQHLGIFPYEMIIEPYTVRGSVQVGDRYLLCSDGLTDMLTDGEIEQVFDKGISIEQTGEELIQTALNKGGKDNVTVLVCEIESIQKRGGAVQSSERQEPAVPIVQDNIDSETINTPKQTEPEMMFPKEKISSDKMQEHIDLAEKKSKTESVAFTKKNSSKKSVSFPVVIIALIVMLLIGFVTGMAVQKKKDEAKDTQIAETVEEVTNVDIPTEDTITNSTTESTTYETTTAKEKTMKEQNTTKNQTTTSSKSMDSHSNDSAGYDLDFEL